MIIFFLAVSFLFMGLFAEFGACIYTGIWGILFLIRFRKKRKLRGKQAMPVSCCYWQNIFTVCVIAVFYLFTCFYGTDRGMSVIGFVKFLGVPFFLGYLGFLKKEEKKKIYQMIPVLGCFMTLTGILARFCPPVYEYFYVADRLGGFFQYPNVFALFCLVGICLLMEDREKIRKTDFCQMLVLFTGILLSGSRTVFFLTLCSIFLSFVFVPAMRKPLLIMTGILAVFIVVYVISTGSMQNAGRFLTTSLSSSTLIGRIIYWKDGLKELLRHPFGLGYLGYYYREPVFQRAYYSVRFIHNEYLQLALDVGILPALLFTVNYGRMLFRKDLSFGKKTALFMMLLHFFMDFDLEFVSIWYLLVLLADGAEGTVVPKRLFPVHIEWKSWMDTVIKAGSVCVIIIALYFGVAMMPRFFGNAKLSSAMMPFYTESNKDILSQETDMEEAKSLAEKVRRQNPYIAEVYDVLAVDAFRKGEYEQVIQEKKKSLSLQKYNMDAYERYLVLLAKGINAAIDGGDKGQLITLLKGVDEVPEILKEVEEATDPLAYRTRDIPDFTLSDWSQDFLKQVKEYEAMLEP